MSSPHRRGPWSNTEDRFLLTLISTHVPLNWVRIAQTFGSRTPKQCRERYHQSLKPSLNHEPITADEGAQIEGLVRTIGKRWAEIARRLDGRSDNAVKNWWNGSQDREKRVNRHRTTHPTALYCDDIQRAPLSLVNTALTVPHCSYPKPSASNPRHRIGSWGDVPFLSPCSSEPGPDSWSNYTTSPADRSRCIHSPQPPIKLPPLTGWYASNQKESQLPRPSSMGRPEQRRSGSDPACLPPSASSCQLIAAPISPVQKLQEKGQEQAHGQEQQKQLPQPLSHPRTQQPRSSDLRIDGITGNDRMKLATLLT